MAIYIRKPWSWLFLAVLICSFLLSCSNHSDSSRVKTSEKGKQVYQRYCLACHGERGNMGAGNAADLSQSTIGEDSIRRVILYGNNKGMGPYKTIIKNDTTLNALIKYVKTLRTD